MSWETVREASRLSGVPERTVREWLSGGRLTYREVRGVLRVDPLEVMELAEMQRRIGQLPRKDKK